MEMERAMVLKNCSESTILILFQVGDLLNMDCQVDQPIRVGIGFSYDEIREKCNKVVNEERFKKPDPDASGLAM